MKKRSSLIAVVVLMSVLGMSSLPAFAALPAAPALPLKGKVLTDAELESVEGEGLASALLAAAVAAVTEYLDYAFDYLWDTYIDGEEATWDWSEVNQDAATSAAAAFVVALLIPSA